MIAIVSSIERTVSSSLGIGIKILDDHNYVGKSVLPNTNIIAVEQSGGELVMMITINIIQKRYR
jgi:hypothetical protein